jgi:hypothetical protein
MVCCTHGSGIFAPVSRKPLAESILLGDNWSHKKLTIQLSAVHTSRASNFQDVPLNPGV